MTLTSSSFGEIPRGRCPKGVVDRHRLHGSGQSDDRLVLVAEHPELVVVNAGDLLIAVPEALQPGDVVPPAVSIAHLGRDRHDDQLPHAVGEPARRRLHESELVRRGLRDVRHGALQVGQDSSRALARRPFLFGDLSVVDPQGSDAQASVPTRMDWSST